MDSYGHELASIAIDLGFAEHVSVRGRDSAGFVYAEHGNRAVEISRSDTGWWVEFWEDEEVACDVTLVDTDEAVKAAAHWLKAGAKGSVK
jgi:hypothetical protein